MTSARVWALLAAGSIIVLAGRVDAQPSAPVVLPPMNFVSTVASDDLLAALKSDKAFANLDKGLVGSPIMLLVTDTLRDTAAGAVTGFLSAIVAGSTLGLLPLVTNRRLVVTYEIRVNGKEVTYYSYEMTYTRAVNLWAERNDPSRGLGKKGMAWLKSTATRFAADAAKDPKLAELVSEYNFYFGPHAR